MPKKNLTHRFCETVKVETRTDFQDEIVRGLSLRVSPEGARTWNLIYARDSDGTKQRVKLGRFPAMSLEKARTAALKAMTNVAEGGDPAGARKAQREAMTVEELGKRYLDEYAKRRKRTWTEDERILKREVYPEIGRMKAIAIRRRDVLDIIEAKARAGRVTQSTQILAVIRKLFNWAVDSDYLEGSPAIGIKPRGKAVRRDRVLSDDEMREIWQALSGAPISAAMRDVIRLLFLTGQRSGEVAGMRRDEIDADRAIWTIPAERAKNGRAHRVPLSPAAMSIVESALARAEEDEFAPLFSRVGEPFTSSAIAQAVRLKLQLSDRAWTPHDARRTVATGMASLGIVPHHVEAVLNHISGFRAGVAGVYNRAAYEAEKRRALDIWAAHVETVKGGSAAVVVPIRAGASDGQA